MKSIAVTMKKFKNNSVFTNFFFKSLQKAKNTEESAYVRVYGRLGRLQGGYGVGRLGYYILYRLGLFILSWHQNSLKISSYVSAK